MGKFYICAAKINAHMTPIKGTSSPAEVAWLMTLQLKNATAPPSRTPKQEETKTRREYAWLLLSLYRDG
jgi:hypothetical protein